jgi:hypothetical protein
MFIRHSLIKTSTVGIVGIGYDFLSSFPKRVACMAPNKQLQRTVTGRRVDGASAPFHYALALRFKRHRAAAELRRYASSKPAMQ